MQEDGKLFIHYFIPNELEALLSQLISLDPLVFDLLLKIIEKVECVFPRPSKRQSIDIDQDYN